MYTCMMYSKLHGRTNRLFYFMFMKNRNTEGAYLHTYDKAGVSK